MAERKRPTPGAGNESTAAGSAGTTEAAGRTAVPGRAESEQGRAGLGDKLRDRASAQLNTQKDRATQGLSSVSEAVRGSTRQLRDQDHATVANYVERAADQIDRLSRQLKQKDVGELVEDAQRLARRRPGLFVGAAFAAGVLGARFLKSSSPGPTSEYEGGERWSGRAAGSERGYAASEGRYTGSEGGYAGSTSPGSTGGYGRDEMAGRAGGYPERAQDVEAREERPAIPSSTGQTGTAQPGTTARKDKPDSERF